MPVFFFIDPEITEDPSMENCKNITLSYTFFKTDEDDDEEIQKLIDESKRQNGLLVSNSEKKASQSQSAPISSDMKK